MELHNYNLEDKIITNDKYKFTRNPPAKYELRDKVLCYFDGYDRKIIPLSVALAFPIIYDSFFDNDKLSDLTIAICPFTLAVAAFSGKFQATKKVENSCLIITNGEKAFSIINSFDQGVRKFQVDIKILRNVFSEYPDCRYMNLLDTITIKPIVDLDYYTNGRMLFKHIYQNQLHPKTLVYLILYKSSKDQKTKSTIIVGRDANPNKDSGYDMVKSGIQDYLLTYNEKIIQKFGSVIPVLWFAWKSFFPNSKIIFIP